MKKAIAFLLAAVLCLLQCSCGKSEEEVMDTQDQAVTATAFSEPAEWEESAEKTQESEEEQTYNRAVARMEEGVYSEAVELFAGLGNYKNADAYWKLCATKAMLDDPLYLELVSLLGMDSLADAIDYGCVVPDAYGNGKTEVYFYLKNSQPLDFEYIFEMRNGCHIRIPTTYGELYEAGWRAIDTNRQSEFRLKEAELDDLYQGSTMLFSDMVGTNGETIGFTLCHEGEATQLRKVPVIGINVNDSEMQGVSVNGITQGATVSEIVKAFGLPCNVHAMHEGTFLSIGLFYGLEPGGDHLRIGLDAETGRLANLAYTARSA